MFTKLLPRLFKKFNSLNNIITFDFHMYSAHMKRYINFINLNCSHVG